MVLNDVDIATPPTSRKTSVYKLKSCCCSSSSSCCCDTFQNVVKSQNATKVDGTFSAAVDIRTVDGTICSIVKINTEKTQQQLFKAFFCSFPPPLLPPRPCLIRIWGAPAIALIWTLLQGYHGLGREGCRVFAHFWFTGRLTPVGLAGYLNPYPYQE